MMINDQLEDIRITNLEEVCMFQQINYGKLKEAYILHTTGRKQYEEEEKRNLHDK